MMRISLVDDVLPNRIHPHPPKGGTTRLRRGRQKLRRQPPIGGPCPANVFEPTDGDACCLNFRTHESSWSHTPGSCHDAGEQRASIPGLGARTALGRRLAVDRDVLGAPDDVSLTGIELCSAVEGVECISIVCEEIVDPGVSGQDVRVIGARERIVDAVIADATAEHVVARVPVEEVVARTAHDEVVARAPSQATMRTNGAVGAATSEEVVVAGGGVLMRVEIVTPGVATDVLVATVAVDDVVAAETHDHVRSGGSLDDGIGMTVIVATRSDDRGSASEAQRNGVSPDRDEDADRQQYS